MSIKFCDSTKFNLGSTGFDKISSFFIAFWYPQCSKCSNFNPRPAILVSNRSSFNTFSYGMAFETIVKVPARAMQTTFTFTIVSNAIPYEQVLKELRFWYQYCRSRAKIEALRALRIPKKRHFWWYLANPRESQIEILWSHRTWWTL